jgi:hypothetical protein
MAYQPAKTPDAPVTQHPARRRAAKRDAIPTKTAPTGDPMAVIERLVSADGLEELWLFECPGCKIGHSPITKSQSRPCWGFNGDVEKPTFTPSILVRWPDPDGGPETVCHSFVRDGNIEFLGDCTHSLAGKTVPLPQIPLENR